MFLSMRDQEKIEKGRELGLAEGMEKGLAEGMEKGLAEGIEKGIEKGRTEGIREVALNLAEMGTPIEQIAEAVKLSCSQVHKWLAEK